MVLDISSRNERNEEKKQLTFLKGLTAFLDEAVTITRTEENGGTRIVHVNDAFTRLTGYKRDEVLGKTPGFLQGPETDPQVLSRLSQDLKEDQPFHGRAVNYRKNGESFMMDWEVVSFHDDQGRKSFYMAIQREGDQG